ncbi:helix-turn-helix transcriptional regulator [Fulvivirga maritima]|uniref:winged helix-turn-helix transcriptional regulator n=1 Tax=Fulvivirga maritima TaxID=2904247 RepID=UPI001F41B572|nr:helix-turn-helix domain-containing protein [Fulvivirga maritima]UII25456.1 helix-turn-helix transcriptional regulator [Fulvivirga maritima]
MEEQDQKIKAVHDAMDILNGKWKISVISSICYHSSRRFSEILNDVKGISNKMLSKELKELEKNELVTRTVLDTQPITVEYKLTDYGQSLRTIIDHLSDWGMAHRKKSMYK